MLARLGSVGKQSAVMRWKLPVHQPPTHFAALQPGTVRSRLSTPFLAGAEATESDVSAALLLDALDATPASGEAVFIDYRGRSIEW